jgi:hypothetical protein
VLTVVTFLSDNAKGACTLSMERLGKMLNRSTRGLQDTIKRLEEVGLVIVQRRPGLTMRISPAIHLVFAEYGGAVAWFIEALSPPQGARGRPRSEGNVIYAEATFGLGMAEKTPEACFVGLQKNPGRKLRRFSEKPRKHDAKTPEACFQNPGSVDSDDISNEIPKEKSLIYAAANARDVVVDFEEVQPQAMAEPSVPDREFRIRGEAEGLGNGSMLPGAELGPLIQHGAARARQGRLTLDAPKIAPLDRYGESTERRERVYALLADALAPFGKKCSATATGPPD